MSFQPMCIINCSLAGFSFSYRPEQVSCKSPLTAFYFRLLLPRWVQPVNNDLLRIRSEGELIVEDAAFFGNVVKHQLIRIPSVIRSANGSDVGPITMFFNRALL